MEITTPLAICVLIFIQIVGFSLSQNSSEEWCTRVGNELQCDFTEYEHTCMESIVVPCNVSSVHINSYENILLIRTDPLQDWSEVKHLVVYSHYNDIEIHPNAFVTFSSLESLVIALYIENQIETALWPNAIMVPFPPNGTFVGLDNLTFLHLAVLVSNDFSSIQLFDALGETETLKNTYRRNYVDWNDFFRAIFEGRNLDTITLAYFDIPNFSLDKLYYIEVPASPEIVITESNIDRISLDIATNSIGRFNEVTFVNTTFEELFFVNDSVSFKNPNFKTLSLIERLGGSECPVFTVLEIGNLSKCFATNIKYSECWRRLNPDFNRCPLRLNQTTAYSNIASPFARHLARQIYFVDLSKMNITFISPSVLHERVLHVSLSDNDLGAMQSNEVNDFKNLLTHLRMLQFLNLNKNRLSNLPYDIFSKNVELKSLLLAGNHLQTLCLNMKDLKLLKLVDLSNNKIQIVDGQTRAFVDQFRLELKIDVKFDISGNPYMCTCDMDSLQSIEWIKSSSAIESNKGKYSCQLNGQSYELHHSALYATQDYCKQKETLQKLAAILSPVVIVLVLCVLVTLRVIRYIKRMRKRKTILDQIKNNELPWRYLVFLSFCSDDDDFVMNMIFPQLTKTLADLTKTNVDLICVGDRHFVPGRPLGGQIIETIHNSAVMLAVVSKDYCKRNWCQTEIMEAYNVRKPIIMLMKEHVTKDQMGDSMGKIFNRYTHASWKPDHDGGHLEPDWPDLGNAIIELATTSNIEEEEVQEEIDAETNV